MGTFSKENRKRIIVSNASCEEDALVSLEPVSGWKLSGVFTFIEANASGPEGEMKTWELNPGGSVVIDMIKD
jgi:hypothetical protein